MASSFLFAEKVRSIVRSGGKDIKIAEGTRISSAAADLIKEHRLRVVPTALDDATAEQIPSTDSTLSAPNGSATHEKPPRKTNCEPSPAPGGTVEIEDDELEAIVDRVLERFQQLKAGQVPAKAAPGPATEPTVSTASDNADDLIICRCEEITRGEIKSAIRNGMQTLNGIKRVTRAGMGLCQGQTCQRLVAQILSQELGISPADIDPTTARGPVRPLRLGVFANN